MARPLGRRPRTAAVAVGAIVWGWAVAQRPDLLPGQITIDEAAAGRPTLLAVLVAMGIGALVLVPSLAYLFWLVLAGPPRQGPAPGDEPTSARCREPARATLAAVACVVIGAGP